MADSRVSFILPYGVAVATVSTAIAARVLMNSILDGQFVFSPILLAVLITSWYGGRGPAMLAVVIGALSASYFLLPPRGSFGGGNPEHQVGLFLYFLTGCGMSFIAGSMHSAQRALLDANAGLELHMRERTKELAQSSEKLRLSEEHFRLLVEGASGHAMIMLNPTGRIASWSPGAERITGYRAEEIVGKDIAFIYPPESEAGGLAKQSRSRAVENGRVEEDGQLVRKDGVRFWASVTISPLHDGEHELLGFVIVLQDITERRATETILEERERLLNVVTSSARVGLVVVDADYAYRFANEAYADIFGLDPVAIVGRRVPEVLPDAWNQIKGHLDRALAGSRVRYELALPGREGFPAVCYYDVNYEPRIAENGARTVVAVVLDITERKMTGDKLLESKAKLEAAMASMTDAVFISDATGHFIHFNDAFATFHRFKNISECAKQLSQYPDIIDVFMADGTEAPLEMWAVPRALRGETVANAVYTICRKDSGEHWIGSYSFSPIRDDVGEIVGSVVVARDVTEQRRIEKSVEASEARYRTLFEYAPDGIVITDPTGQILDGNASICQMLGYARSEFIGLPVSDMADMEEFEHIEPALAALNRGENYYREWRFRRKDGTSFPTEVIATPMPDGNLMGMVRDISDRKQIEETEVLFRALLDRSEDAIEVIDPETGHFLDGNEKAWLSLGYSRDEFLSLRVADIDPEVAKDPWPDRMEALRQSGVAIIESIHRRKDGTEFPVELNAKYVSLARDYAIAVARDITERKRVEHCVQAQHAVTEILAASPSLEEACAQTLDALCNAFGWLRAEIWTIERGSASLRCYMARHPGSDKPDALDEACKCTTFGPGVGLPGRIWSERCMVSIPDIAEDDTFARTDEMMRMGLRSAAGFPICIGADVRGVICFFSGAMAPSDDALTSAVTAISNQIGQFVERKLAEEASRESDERFRQIAENIREVFWLNDVINRKVLFVGPAYEAIWGRTCESLYASPNEWMEAIHPDDRARAQYTFQNEPSMGKFDVVYRIVRPDATIRWIHDRGFPVRNEAGEMYRIAGVAEDITERVQAESASQLHKMRLEGIVNSAMDGIITIGEDQRVILINQAAERMFGCLAEEVLGDRVERFIPERFRATHEGHVRLFGQTGIAARAMGVVAAVRGLRSNGEEFPLEASISHIDVEGRRLYTVTCRDVTDRIEADEIRRKLEAQLHQSQKMEAFGQLAGGVAHDFNNLLTVILGYSEWLLDYLPPETETISMIGEIKRSGERAAALTRQLLAFSRQQVIAPKVLDLNLVVTDVEKMLRRLIGEDVQLSTGLDAFIQPVLIDPGQIEQVIMNLAVNARDAMPQGGRLTIETRSVELDAGYAKSHEDFCPGTYVQLAMSDTGAGMPPEVKSRIFEPFFTTKGVGRGTGLGLAVVHGIVKQSGGSIDVYSEPGAGTTFKIYLPVVSETLLSSARNVTHTPRGNEVILLVEDEAGVRDIAALSLKGLGYHVFQASNGDEALQCMAEHGATIELLLTDVVMPEMSGRALAESLVAEYPGLKVLFVSGYTDDAIVRHGVLRAEVAFLQKPFTLNALGRKVREVLDQT